MYPLFLVLFLCFNTDNLSGLTDAIRYLSGISDIEVLPSDEAERYENFSRHPLKINSCSKAALVASGLFSSYQVETIMDWRLRLGPVCSEGELAAVDGFNPTLSHALSFFVDFSPDTSPVKVLEAEASAFVAAKTDGKTCRWQWMGRGKLSYAGFSASVATKSVWNAHMSLPEDVGLNLSYNGSRWLSCATAGWFNARFAQGLCLWTGMQIENYSTPSALMKRPSSVSPYTSSSVQYAMRGAAVRMDFGPIGASVLYDCSSHRAAANVSWNHRHGQVGVTAWVIPSSSLTLGGCGEKWLSSIDFQQVLGPVTLYGETTVLQTLLGVRFPIGRVDCGVRAFWSKTQHNAAVAASWTSTSGKHTLDFGSLLDGYPQGKGEDAHPDAQLKALCTWSYSPTDNWKFTTRASVRLRTWTQDQKVDIRQDVLFSLGRWSASARINLLHCQAHSVLSYLDGAYKFSAADSLGRYRHFEFFLRGGVFLVDNWEDRIYVYMRDAPQSFNSPAMYGRGYFLAAYACAKPWKFLAIYLRGDWTAYPWAREEDKRKEASLNVKLQIVATLPDLRLRRGFPQSGR